MKRLKMIQDFYDYFYFISKNLFVTGIVDTAARNDMDLFYDNKNTNIKHCLDNNFVKMYFNEL